MRRIGQAVLGIVALASLTGATAPRTFTNPLLPSGPDPWIARAGSTYYLMKTDGNRLVIRASPNLGGFRDAVPHTVWTPPAHGPNAISVWAPELHRIDGKWFIYYTAAEDGHDDDAHRGIFVLENDAADPLAGTWIDRGRLKTQHNGIDGTTFAYRGQRYFVYSPYVGPESDLAIVRMANPWTLEGPEVVIARPDREWETRGGRSILEGPEFLAGPKGDLFLTYSAGACWSDDYALGLLHAAPGSDPLAPQSWQKAPQPVLKKSPANSVYATGHNGFFTSPDGRENWIVFHANPGPDMKCTAKRAPHAQRFNFDANGYPVLGEPLPAGRALAEPSAQASASKRAITR
ncbi:glycoside hydrolase family 43 protein [Sphingomonas oryzagri]|uniref:glycoside hydrolase family 43 protein n=1 Tax=Sphingomonas oryzagri TaxID=3042314 RepID=UPI0024786DF7|nr:glycoside hydrolase family 43 protein [Sphingomonas oryzagri]